MATERFSGVLLIMIQEYQVNIEETDGLTIRLQLDDLLDRGQLITDADRAQIVRKDPNTPLELDVEPEPALARATLSLFQTCPEYPTHSVTAGRLSLSTFTIAAEPEDTGNNEHLAGTLTATLARANADDAVGTLNARFDFHPPTRPLTTFK